MSAQELEHRGPAALVSFVVKISSPSLPTHPASELEKQSADTLGYVAVSTPAELILELQNAPRYALAQLQLLSHESKIASRIEISVSESSGTPFRPVGYLELGENSKSGYMARELQCVKLECPSVSQVKLVLHEAHPNELNPKGHVGIVGLNLLGWPLATPAPSAAASERSAPAVAANAPAETRSVPSSPTAALAALSKKAEELRQAKESAVSREQYDEALRLKTAEADVRKVIEEANEIERAKQAAVAREDYDAAKELRLKLKALLSRGVLETGQSGTGPASPVRPMRSVEAPSSPEPRRPIPTAVAAPRSPPVPAVVSAQKQQRMRGIHAAEGPVAEGPPAGFWAGIPDSDVLPVAETLDVHLESSDEVRMLRSAFDAYSVRCVFSADIRLRVAVLERIESHIRLGKLAAGEAAVHVAALGLAETAPHAFLCAVRLLETIFESAPLEKLRDLTEMREAVLLHLTDGLSNASAHVQQAAADNLVRLASELLGCDAALKHLLAKQQRKSTLWKPLVARMGVLERLAALLNQSESPEMWTLEALEWMKSTSSFTHANEQVREAALTLTSALYAKADRNLRLAVEDFLRANLRPATLEKYLAVLSSGGSGAGGAKQPTRNSPLYRQDHPVYQTATGPEEPGNDGTCPLCNERGLASESDLDLHWWRDCPMLAHCPHCRQVIEISRLNEHLLEECRYRENHKACPRCGEAIAAQLFEKHLRKNSCLPAKSLSEANRCPLCHQDVAPFDSGWRMHLLIDTCPYNVRTMDLVDEEDDGDFTDEVDAPLQQQ